MKTTRILRQLIITVGFLPGLWFYLGVHPDAVITYPVIDAIARTFSQASMASEVSNLALVLYSIYGFLGVLATWVGVLFVGPGWGMLAVAAAFAGGLFITSPFGIWLFIGVWIIAWFLPVDKDRSSDL
jgi:hypothetical protein